MSLTPKRTIRNPTRRIIRATVTKLHHRVRLSHAIHARRRIAVGHRAEQFHDFAAVRPGRICAHCLFYKPHCLGAQTDNVVTLHELVNPGGNQPDFVG
jgi:hypothetical protein